VNESEIVERAIAWALEQLGSSDYALRCLSFVEDAYEIANDIEIFGGSTARESAEIYAVSGSVGEPPAGAFVFFETSGLVDGTERDWGHVGLATGDGRMVHAWQEVRLDRIYDMPSLPSGSWSPPAYIGFAPPARVLYGARRVIADDRSL
jgi:cell wall-associated NlpC family hydrolase